MSLVVTYRYYVAKLVAGVDFLTDYLGERYAGTYGLIADCVAQGVTFAFESRLAGHPNQAEDALNQQGADADLFRYRGESLASWRSRVSNPWPSYEQSGTPIQLLRAINEWGYIVFPATWDASKVKLTEGPLERFTIWLEPGLTDWQPSWKWGDGSLWGQPGLLYGITNAVPEDVNALRRIVRKWKRAASKGKGCIVISGHVWGQPGLVWGGFNYGPGNRVVLGF